MNASAVICLSRISSIIQESPPFPGVVPEPRKMFYLGSPGQTFRVCFGESCIRPYILHTIVTARAARGERRACAGANTRSEHCCLHAAASVHWLLVTAAVLHLSADQRVPLQSAMLSCRWTRALAARTARPRANTRACVLHLLPDSAGGDSDAGGVQGSWTTVSNTGPSGGGPMRGWRRRSRDATPGGAGWSRTPSAPPASKTIFDCDVVGHDGGV